MIKILNSSQIIKDFKPGDLITSISFSYIGLVLNEEPNSSENVVVVVLNHHNGPIKTEWSKQNKILFQGKIEISNEE